MAFFADYLTKDIAKPEIQLLVSPKESRIGRLHLSVTHDADLVMAFVVAEAFLPN